jgi:tetracycline repressor-like protein
VIRPALAAPRGLRRLWSVHERRLAFYTAEVLPGGCFFANAHFASNARPGLLRDRLAAELTDVRLDPATMRPAPWTDHGRALTATLVR